MGRQSGGIRGTFRPRQRTLADVREENPIYRRSRTRKELAQEMAPLLSVKINKETDRTIIPIGFKRGNESIGHIIDDVKKRLTRVITEADLPRMDEILRNAEYVKSAPYRDKPDKPKKNARERHTWFHYYKVIVRDRVAYINVKDRKEGKNRERYVYSIRDHIIEE